MDARYVPFVNKSVQRAWISRRLNLLISTRNSATEPKCKFMLAKTPENANKME